MRQILPGPPNYLELACILLSGVERCSIVPNVLNALDFSGGQGFESLPERGWVEHEIGESPSLLLPRLIQTHLWVLIDVESKRIRAAGRRMLL
jgi:hypothetical protein